MKELYFNVQGGVSEGIAKFACLHFDENNMVYTVYNKNGTIHLQCSW